MGRYQRFQPPDVQRITIYAACASEFLIGLRESDPDKFSERSGVLSGLIVAEVIQKGASCLPPSSHEQIGSLLAA